jgi:hypothetical protein
MAWRNTSCARSIPRQARPDRRHAAAARASSAMALRSRPRCSASQGPRARQGQRLHPRPAELPLRKWDKSDNMMSTVAGSGKGSDGDGGLATASQAVLRGRAPTPEGRQVASPRGRQRQTTSPRPSLTASASTSRQHDRHRDPGTGSPGYSGDGSSRNRSTSRATSGFGRPPLHR